MSLVPAILEDARLDVCEAEACLAAVESTKPNHCRLLKQNALPYIHKALERLTVAEADLKKEILA